ncbi:autotransporter domain-containing protein [Bisgaard Taxon 46]
MKKKYQKIIIPTLSILLTSCGGGGGGGGGGSAPSSQDYSYGNNSEAVNASDSLAVAPSAANLSYTSLDSYPNSLSSYPFNAVNSPISSNIYEIKPSSAIFSLNKNMEYIDDENLVRNIGLIDSEFYLSDSFKDSSGKLRLVDHNQSKELTPTIESHGTMVVGVLNMYNKTATFYGYNAYRNNKKEFNPTYSDYDSAYKEGARIFNNSFASPTIDKPYTVYMEHNVKEYAKKDSIFVWSAGNDGHQHSSPQSLAPRDDDDLRNGWISAAEADYSQGISGTNKPKRYWNNKASNYIGENAKTWGLAARGSYRLTLAQDKQYYYVHIAGTSFAAPRISAAAANVWTKFPWMDHHLVVVSLLSTADQPGTFLKGQDGVCESSSSQGCGEPTTGPESLFGWGLLNERRALQGPALFDRRLLTNKDAISTNNGKYFTKDISVSGKNSKKDLLVVNFDFRHYKDKDKLTWSNDIKGDAGILKQGTGTLYLNGENAYSGKTIVDGGILAVGHSLTSSDVIITKNGNLLAEFDSKKYGSSSRVVFGAEAKSPTYTVKNGGTLSVYGLGLKINGNYKGAANSNIVIDIDKSNLDVTGNVDLGGTSKIVADIDNLGKNGIPTEKSQKKKIITAQSISNYNNVTYAKSDNINDYIEISKFYIADGKNINVEYKRNSTDYVLKKANYTPKSAIYAGRNVDRVLNTLSTSPKAHPLAAQAARLFKVDAVQLPRVINSLSGELYASTQSAVVNQNLVANKVLSQRVMSVNSGAKSGFWVDGIYANSSINQNGYASAKIKISGSQIGIDNKVSDKLSLGVALNQSVGNADFNREAGKSNTKSLGAFVYGSYDLDKAYLSTMVGLNHARTNVNRVIFDKHTTSKFNSNIYNVYVELGKNIKFNKVRINPFVANSYTHIYRGSFKENTVFGIDAKSKKYNVNSFIAGVRSDIKFNKLTLNSNLSHAYTPKRNDFGFEAKFTDFEDTIYINGAEQDKHITWLGFGADYEFFEDFSLQLGYNLSIRNGKKDNDVFNLGASYRF